MCRMRWAAMWEGGFQLVKFFRFFKRKTFILVSMVGVKKTYQLFYKPRLLCENLNIWSINKFFKTCFSLCTPTKTPLWAKPGTGPSASNLWFVYWRRVKGILADRSENHSWQIFHWKENKTEQQWGGVLGSGKEAIPLRLCAGSSQPARGTQLHKSTLHPWHALSISNFLRGKNPSQPFYQYEYCPSDYWRERIHTQTAIKIKNNFWRE